MMPFSDEYGLARKVDEIRTKLRQRANCRFVNRDEFSSLAISSRQLVRADEPQAEVRGLLDLVTNERFLMKEEGLFRNEIAHARS